MNLIISQGPHIRSGWTGQRIMMSVFLALLPAAFFGIDVFGWHAAFILISAILSSWACDIAIQHLIRIHKKKQGIFYRVAYLNWSSLLTGLLIGMIMPPGVPVLLPAIGSLFAISLGKYAFGKGNNIFNPALIARVFLAFAFPALMAAWIIPDAITQATPLTVLKESGMDALVTQFGSESVMYSSMALGNIGGCIGETSAMALLAGAIFLLAFGIISLSIPASFIGTVGIISLFAGRDVLFDLLAGGLFLGAFFMATDYVTSPLTFTGKIIFGIGCGALTMLFRMLSGYPEGVAFSILLMNAAVPLIDRYTRPFPLGGKMTGRCKTG